MKKLKFHKKEARFPFVLYYSVPLPASGRYELQFPGTRTVPYQFFFKKHAEWEFLKFFLITLSLHTIQWFLYHFKSRSRNCRITSNYRYNTPFSNLVCFEKLTHIWKFENFRDFVWKKDWTGKNHDMNKIQTTIHNKGGGCWSYLTSCMSILIELETSNLLIHPFLVPCYSKPTDLLL